MKNVFDNWNRVMIMNKNEMVQHQSKQIKPTKNKSKQQAATKFMWHKQK
jgi:hypothetical protein